jgi:hypothetical protein
VWIAPAHRINEPNCFFVSASALSAAVYAASRPPLPVQIFAHDTDGRGRVARGREHPAQEEEVARLNGRHVRAKRRWRGRQMYAEPGETVLGGRCVDGHGDSSFPLPAAEMRATFDILASNSIRERLSGQHGPWFLAGIVPPTFASSRTSRGS